MKYLTYALIFLVGLLVGAGVVYFHLFGLQPEVVSGYYSDNGDFEVKYPYGWRVEEEVVADEGIVTHFIRLQLVDRHSVDIWAFGDQSEAYTREAGKPRAKTFVSSNSGFSPNVDTRAFYVINSTGDISSRDFNLIANSFVMWVAN